MAPRAPATASSSGEAGIVLTSPSSSFGGWSGLALDASGSNLLAISDAGTWMTAEIATRTPKAARRA